MRGLALMTLLAASSGSCSLVLDLEQTQCTSDNDCAAWSGAVCNVDQGVCVAEQASGAASPGPSAARDLDLCRRTDKPMVRLEGDITASDTLDCRRNYLLVGTVFVKAGVTLTIQKGTTVLGDPASKGTLVVQPGARLVAEGTRNEPVVFTSAAAGGARRPGDWGGLILLGRAPVNLTQATIEGITEGGEFGGADENDDSGVLRFVRIEYSGTKLGPNNEINGLTFGGVGRRTVVDHVQVRQTTDDCFEFFGGTVNAKHLVCQWNGDDGFDWDNGYRGKLQFLVLQQDPTAIDETNGFEGDNDALGSSNAPVSEPVIYNATLCGKNVDVDKEQYGILLRRSTRARIFNLIVSGFEAGIDVRDATTQVELGSAIFSGNLVKPLAYEEDGSNAGPQKNDDAGFDELAWLANPAMSISTASPGLGDCFDPNRFRFAPSAPLTAGAARPPADGFFDPDAAFIGAFRDERDDWATGNWVVWSDN